MPDQTLLPAPWRSRTRHRASAYDAGAGAGTDADFEGPGVRIVSAGLCARHSRRPRQGAGRPELPVAGSFFFTRRATTTSRIALSCGRLLRRRSPLSADVMIERSRTKKGRTRSAEASWRVQNAKTGHIGGITHRQFRSDGAERWHGIFKIVRNSVPADSRSADRSP